VLFRLPSFSGRYILGVTLSEVSGSARLYWSVKESNVHLSLHAIELGDDDRSSFSGDLPRQLCYVQAHAASVTFTCTFITLRAS